MSTNAKTTSRGIVLIDNLNMRHESLNTNEIWRILKNTITTEYNANNNNHCKNDRITGTHNKSITFCYWQCSDAVGWMTEGIQPVKPVDVILTFVKKPVKKPKTIVLVVAV